MNIDKLEELIVRTYVNYLCEDFTTKLGDIGVTAKITIENVDMNKLKMLANQFQNEQQKNTDDNTPHIFSDDLDKFYKEKQNDETTKADN